MASAVDYLEYSDEQLIDLYQKGDFAVVNYICEKYKPLVLKNTKAFFLVGGETDDLIQEGMIGLFSAIGDYDSSSSVTFFHFADLCIRRQMMKAVEASNRGKNIPLNSYVSIDNENPDSQLYGEDPVDQIIETESTIDLFDRLMGILSPMEQQVCRLYLQDYNYHEIAEKLGKSDKSIDNTLSRIKLKAKNI